MKKRNVFKNAIMFVVVVVLLKLSVPAYTQTFSNAPQFNEPSVKSVIRQTVPELKWQVRIYNPEKKKVTIHVVDKENAEVMVSRSTKDVNYAISFNMESVPDGYYSIAVSPAGEKPIKQQIKISTTTEMKIIRIASNIPKRAF